MKSSAFGNAKVSFSLEEPEERPPLEFTASAEDAAGSPWSFDRLLGMLSFEAFCSTYWGKYPVLIRGRNPKLFSSLTSLGDIESYFSLPGILDDHVFLRSHQAPKRQKFKSITDMYSEMRAGASIHLPDLEQFLAPDSPIRHLYNNTAERLQHPGHSIHCFITPPGRECLGAHYDENEIFTLQISGRKRWRFFDRVAAVEPSGCATDQPLADFSLGPGDMLYHPRGQVHEVMSEDSVSCSVAIVIRPLTWRELLSMIADDLGNTREFMEQLPAGLSWTNGASTQIAAAMESRLRIIAGKLPALTAQDLVDKIGDGFVKGSPPPPRSQLEGLLHRRSHAANPSPDTKQFGVSHRMPRRENSLVVSRR